MAQGRSEDVSIGCDIVIPIHNALHKTLDLLESLANHTDVSHRIFLMDDASDTHVGEVLRSIADRSESMRIERSEENLGFIRTANAGIALTSAPYICVLNSDTVVTQGWLGKLIRCAESDPSIMIVNPISNSAANLSVVMPPGYTIHMMADRLEQISTGSYPDVVTAVGFCLLIKREAVDRWGGFDEAYGMGYCEESDYCMRVMADGFRVVAADDAFVYHKGETTFLDRNARYFRNRKLFDARWGRLYQPMYAAFLKRNPLQYLRNRLFDGLVPARHQYPARFSTSNIYKIWRVLGYLGRGEYRVLAVRVQQELGARAEQITTSIRKMLGGRSADQESRRHFMEGFIPEDQPLTYPTAGYVRSMPRSPKRLRVVFLLHEAPLAGGVIQVCQLVNQMILEGHDAIIVTTSREEFQKRLGLLCQPLVYPDSAQLIEEFPGADVVIATFWMTAWHWMGPLTERYNFLPVYYVQDFEPYFYPEHVPERKLALESYAKVSNRIVTSTWLQETLRTAGYEAIKIPVGINLGIYYPRPKPQQDGQFTVTAITRPDPGESRRGFQELVEACAIVHGKDPSIRFEFFGCDPRAMPEGLPFPYAHKGVVTSPEHVAQHLARCDLLVDPSHYQAFGRPGLEAMACRTATVLPDAGGIWEYARDGENTLMFQPQDPESMANAVLRIRGDREMRERLVENGVRTVQAFDHKEEGRRHLAFYRELLGGRLRSAELA